MHNESYTISTCTHRQLETNSFYLPLNYLNTLLTYYYVPSLFSTNTRSHLEISCVSGSSGSTGTPGLLQATPHIRFLKNDTASSTAVALFTILITTNIRDKVEGKKNPNSSLLRLTMSYSCTLPRYRSLRLWRFFELYNSA